MICGLTERFMDRKILMRTLSSDFIFRLFSFRSKHPDLTRGTILVLVVFYDKVMARLRQLVTHRADSSSLVGFQTPALTAEFIQLGVAWKLVGTPGEECFGLSILLLVQEQ